jgi:hypothetical protein
MTDPDWESTEGDRMIFRLTYEGPLPAVSHSNTRKNVKNQIRDVLHPQLRRLWVVHPILNELKAFKWGQNPPKTVAPMVEVLADQFERCGFNFVPLVSRWNGLACAIRILFLRPHQPGKELIQSGDLDNRLKIIFEALRLPSSLEEIGNAKPTDDQRPYFCLLEDDSLINHVEIETDLMLESVGGSYDKNDVRLIITVETIRTSPAMGAQMF